MVPPNSARGPASATAAGRGKKARTRSRSLAQPEGEKSGVAPGLWFAPGSRYFGGRIAIEPYCRVLPRTSASAWLPSALACESFPFSVQ